MKHYDVVAFEGSMPTPESAVAWGAGAVVRAGQLINPRTGQAGPESELSEYVEHRRLTPLLERIRVEAPRLAPVAVCVFVAASATRFRGDPNQRGGVVATERQGDYVVDVFDSTASFRLFAKHRATQIAGLLLAELQPGADLTPAQVADSDAGLVLDPWSPELLALRCAYMPPENRAAELRMARALLSRRADILSVFERHYESMRRDKPSTFGLKFQGKKADQPAGFPVPVLIDVLQISMKSIGAASRADVIPWHFTTPANDTVAATFGKTGSVVLEFSAPQDVKTELDRVVWNLRLGVARDVIAGREAPGARVTDDLKDRLRRVYEEYADVVSDRRAATEEFVALPRFHGAVPGEGPSAVVRTLVYLAGMGGEGRRLELRPPGGRALTVSGESNGADPSSVPEGAAFITSRSKLYRAFAVRLEIPSPSGDGKTHLLAIEELEPGSKVRLTGFPSSILKDTYVIGAAVDVTVETGATTIGRTEFASPLPRARLTAHAWTKQAQVAFRSVEEHLLQTKSDAMRYFPAFTSRQHLHIAVGILAQLGKPVLESTLLALIQLEIGSPKRMNNTQKIIRHQREFVHAEDGRTVSLSPEGSLLAAAMRRAGWRLRREIRDEDVSTP